MQLTRRKPTWICVTGIDGTGKTTICAFLKEQLDGRVAFMKIPHFDWVREMIALSGKNTPYGDSHTDTLIFSAGNRLEMTLINELLAKKDFLITQRCWLDNFPYRTVQGVSRRESMACLRPQSFRQPDIILYLKCSSTIAYERIKNDHGDKYETKEFMERLEPAFERMFQDIQKGTFPVRLDASKVITIDASGPIDDVKDQVKRALESQGVLSAQDRSLY